MPALVRRKKSDSSGRAGKAKSWMQAKSLTQPCGQLSALQGAALVRILGLEDSVILISIGSLASAHAGPCHCDDARHQNLNQFLPIPESHQRGTL